MNTCDHIICFIYNYDSSDTATLEDLKAHVANNRRSYEHFWTQKYYTLADYCDKRKSTDILRFEYCPMCGEKIDWKAIKDGADNECKN